MLELNVEIEDGNNIFIGAEVFRCVEVLFQQSFSSKKTANPRHISPVS